jgi:hypothetical protein
MQWWNKAVKVPRNRRHAIKGKGCNGDVSMYSGSRRECYRATTLLFSNTLHLHHQNREKKIIHIIYATTLLDLSSWNKHIHTICQCLFQTIRFISSKRKEKDFQQLWPFMRFILFITVSWSLASLLLRSCKTNGRSPQGAAWGSLSAVCGVISGAAACWELCGNPACCDPLKAACKAVSGPTDKK